METLEAAAMLKGFLIGQSLCPPEIAECAEAILKNVREKFHSPRTAAIVIDTKDIIIPHPLIRGTAKPKKASVPKAPVEKKKRQRKSKLDVPAQLSTIQAAHDRGESNGAIAERYSVSDQTIVNFLKRHGRYAAPGRGARPTASTTAEPGGAPERQDAFGDKMLAPKGFNPYPGKKKAKAKGSLGSAYSGIIQPGNLVDIYDMLAEGKSLEDVAEHYGCEKTQLEEFILANRNAQITKLPPKPAAGIYSNNHMTKPTSHRNRRD